MPTLVPDRNVDHIHALSRFTVIKRAVKLTAAVPVQHKVSCAKNTGGVTTQIRSYDCDVT